MCVQIYASVYIYIYISVYTMYIMCIYVDIYSKTFLTDHLHRSTAPPKSVTIDHPYHSLIRPPP